VSQDSQSVGNRCPWPGGCWKVPGAWRTIDAIGYSGSISAGKGHMYLGDSAVGLADVAIVLVGPHCVLNESLFNRAAEYDVSVVHCDWKGSPVAMTLPWSENSRVASRHRAQANLSVPRQKNAWMRVVKAKIRGQANAVSSLTGKRDVELLDLAGKVKSGDPSNVEARAARLYWKKITLDSQFRRIPRERVGTNAFLDYTYAVLRGVCARGVVAAGLNPSLGIWHHNRSNSFALVDDLIEPFRPIADLLALGVAGTFDELTPESKRKLVEVCELRFDKSGTTVTTTIMNFAKKFAIYVEGGSSLLDVPVFEGAYEDG
jgi:CRISPR-associated protein Cas1